MFADDAIDGTVTEDLLHSGPANSPNRSNLLIESSPTILSKDGTSGSFRRSKSCPCTPKHGRKKSQRRQHFGSPESPHHSPKSVSSGSKFSLGGSLMAIHKQASSSLRAELLKHDHTSKMVGAATTGAMKMRSLQSSVKRRVRSSMSHSSINEEDNLSECSEGEIDTNRLSVPVNPANYTKKPIQESKSLPTLKSSRVSGHSEISPVEEDLLISETNGVLSEDEATDTEECDYTATTFSVPQYDVAQGVVNLGFDGHAESSDFTNTDENSSIAGEKVIQVPVMSLGYSQSPASNAAGIDLPAQNVNLENDEMMEHVQQTNFYAFERGVSDSENCTDERSESFASYASDNTLSIETDVTASTAPVTAQSSPSALRIRVFDNVLPNHPLATGKGLLAQMNSTHHSFSSNVIHETMSASGVVSGQLRPRPPILTKTEAADDDKNDFIIEEDELLTDNMIEARAMVYWWENNVDSDVQERQEFCFSEGKCKKTPMLMFIHGVGGSSDDWQEQLWYFVSQGYEVVAPDLLGHGFSSAPDDVNRYQFHRLLEHLRLLYELFVPPGRKCVLVGHGYGCALVTALSRIQGNSVPLLALAAGGGPTPLIPPYPNSVTSFHPYYQFNKKFFLDKKMSLPSCCDNSETEGAFQRMRDIISATCWLTCCLPCSCIKCEPQYAPHGKLLCGGSMVKPGVSATPPYVLRHVIRGQSWPEGDMTFHRRILIPVLLLHGLQDTSVPLVHMCDMEKTIPRAFLEILNCAGHQLMTDSPQEFNNSLHRFIKRWERLT